MKKSINNINYREFKENTFKELFIYKTKFDRFDGIFSLIYSLTLFIFLFISAIYSDLQYLQYVGYIIFILIILAYLKIRHQKLETIGFRKDTFFDSLSTGFVWSFIILFLILAIKIINNTFSFNKDLNFLIEKGLYYLICVSFFEEVVFRGFLNDRLRGLFRNSFISITICALLFSMMHLPYRIILSKMDIGLFFEKNWFKYLILFLLHFFFQYFYYRNKNITAPIIIHFFYDYLQLIF